MTGEELRAAIEKANMTIAEFAEQVGKHKRTVQRWLSGELPVPKYVTLIFK